MSVMINMNRNIEQNIGSRPNTATLIIAIVIQSVAQASRLGTMSKG